MKNKKIIAISTIVCGLIFNNVYAHVDDLPSIEIHLENLHKIKPKAKEHMAHSVHKKEEKAKTHLVEHKKKKKAKVEHIKKIEKIEEEPKFVEVKKPAEDENHKQVPVIDQPKQQVVQVEIQKPEEPHQEVMEKVKPIQDIRKVDIKSEDLAAPPVASPAVVPTIKQEQTPIPPVAPPVGANVVHAEIEADKVPDHKNVQKPNIVAPAVIEPAKPAPVQEEKQQNANIAEKLALTINYLDQENLLNDSNKKLLEKFAEEANKKRYSKIRIASYAPSTHANDIAVKKISLQRVISVRKMLMDLGVSSAKLNVQAIEASDAGSNKIEIFVTQ